MNLKDLSRPLDISDVDFRIQSINNGGYATVLAYKDARVDMNRLDEVLTPLGWQRDYKFIDGKLFCGVGILNPNNDQWVWKWDVGTESMTEKEKGMASDAFKRACFNLGIGRELYSYPFISVKLKELEWTKEGGRPKQTFNLKLKDWKWYSEFTDGKLSFIAAKDETGAVRFKWGELQPKVKEPEYKAASPIADEVVTEEYYVQPSTEEQDANVEGILKKSKDPVQENLNLEIDTVRPELIKAYTDIYGKAPHGRMSNERIAEEIQNAQKLEESINEEIIPEISLDIEIEEEEIIEIEEEDIEEEINSILNHADKIETYTDPSKFVAWAKEIVSEYISIDSADTIESFKALCNNHYSKIV
jgi:hypothetical protein